MRKMVAPRSSQSRTRLPLAVSDQIVLCSHPLSSAHLHCVIVFDGQLDALRLEQALRLSFDDEPLLGCRFVPHWWKPYWDGAEHDPAFELVASTDPLADLATFLSAPIGLERGPQIQLRLLRADSDTLCIKISHLVADAAALKQYAYKLAGFYSNLQAGGHVAWSSLSGHRGIKQVLSRFNWRQKLQIAQLALRSERETSVGLNPWYLATNCASDHQYRYFLQPLGAERLRAIKAYGRRHSATVGDVMLAAFYLACCRLIPQAAVLPVATTVDLRRYLPDGGAQTVCNLCAVIAVVVELGANATLAQAVGAVRDQMNLKKTAYLGLASFLTLPMLFEGLPFAVLKRLIESQLQPLRTTGRIAPMLTNMGLIEPGRLQFGCVPVREAFLTPSVPVEPLVMVGFSSFRESMTLSVGLWEGLLPGASVERLLKHLDSVLP